VDADIIPGHPMPPKEWIEEAKGKIKEWRYDSKGRQGEIPFRGYGGYWELEGEAYSKAQGYSMFDNEELALIDVFNKRERKEVARALHLPPQVEPLGMNVDGAIVVKDGMTVMLYGDWRDFNEYEDSGARCSTESSGGKKGDNKRDGGDGRRSRSPLKRTEDPKKAQGGRASRLRGSKRSVKQVQDTDTRRGSKRSTGEGEKKAKGKRKKTERSSD